MEDLENDIELQLGQDMDLKCPECNKSDMIFATIQCSTGGDRIVYDCERCDRELYSEPWN
jgi:ribosomal protein S27E